MTETRDHRTFEAKDAIFAAIRESLAASVPFDAEHQKHHRPGTSGETQLVKKEIDRQTLIANFKESLESVGGNFHLVLNATGAGEVIRNIVDRSDAKKIAVSDSELVGNSIADLTDLEINRNVGSADLFGFDIGVTSAQWAIAETGTLVLESNREKHRLASLVPPVHVCVISDKKIRQTLGEILEQTGKDLSRTMTFVTGASRTSDIELTLAVGVHGPGELHVIVVRDE